MILYGALVLVILLKENDAKSFRKFKPVRELTSAEDQIINAGVLAKLINKVNEEQSDENIRFSNDYAGDKHSEDHHNVQDKDLDDYEVSNKRNDQGGGPSPTTLKNPLKENYIGPAIPYDEEAREHLIKNPHILEEYKRSLRKKHASTSSESDDSSDYDLRVERFLRRNAVFGVDGQKQKLALRSAYKKNTNYNKHSDADDKVVHFQPKVIKKTDISFKNNNNDDYGKKKRFQEIRNSNIKKDWDEYQKEDSLYAITRNPKNRNRNREKMIDKNNNEYKTNERFNRPRNDNLENEKETNKFQKIRNRGGWDKPKDVKPAKTDNSWDNWKPKSVDFADMMRKGKKDDDWDKNSEKTGTKGIASYETKPKKNEWDRKDDFENEEKKPKKKEWFSRDDLRTKENDWNGGNDHANDERKPKKSEWITKDDFREEKTYKMPSFKKNREDNKPFVPVISNYYNPRPKKRDNVEHAGFRAFGRTSIPFVGKKGIYEEK